jgi:hypothetical protein
MLLAAVAAAALLLLAGSHGSKRMLCSSSNLHGNGSCHKVCWFSNLSPALCSMFHLHVAALHLRLYMQMFQVTVQ